MTSADRQSLAFVVSFAAVFLGVIIFCLVMS